MNIKLVVTEGSNKAQVIRLRAKVTVIGRMHGCDVRIPSGAVSRHHCRLQRSKEALLVEDLESSNGTFVNGKAVKKTVLKAGDLLQVGPVVFLVKILDKSELDDEAVSSKPDIISLSEEEEGEELPIVDDEEDGEEEVDEDLDEGEEAPKPTDKTTSLPSMKALAAKKGAKKPGKEKETTKKITGKDAKGKPGKPKPGKKKPDEEETAEQEALEKNNEDMPDASSILEGNTSWSAPQQNDLRDILGQLEDE